MRGLAAQQVLILSALSLALCMDNVREWDDFQQCPKANRELCGGEGVGTCVYREWVSEGERTLRNGKTFSYKINHKHGYCVCEPGSGRIGVNQPCVLPSLRNSIRKKVAQALIQGKTECDENDGKTTYCPVENWVSASMQGMCVDHFRDCFKGNGTLIERWRNRANAANCSEGERYCMKDQACVVQQADCSIAQTRCNSTTPVRCRGGACAETRDACPAHNFTCGMGKVLCADGLTCMNNHFQCAKRLSYNGCEADMMECPQDPRVCAENATMCVEATGCPADKKRCGRLFNTTTGMIVFGDDGQPMPRCVDTCNRRRLKTKIQKKLNLVGSNVDKQVTWTDEDGNALLTLRIEDGMQVTVAGSDNTTVSFVISPVTDSGLRWGAFRNMWLKNLLYGDPVAVNPESEIEITDANNKTGNISLCIPLYANDEVNTQALCNTFVANLQMFSVEDHNDENGNTSSIGQCMAEYTNGTCHCCASASHFSTFTVSSSEEESATIADDGSDSSSDGNQATQPQATQALVQTTAAPTPTPAPGSSPPPPDPTLAPAPTPSEGISGSSALSPSALLASAAALVLALVLRV